MERKWMRCVGDVEKKLLRKRDRKRDIDCWRTRDRCFRKSS